MKIGAEFKSNEWPALLNRLESNDAAAWQDAIDLLDHRINDRYLNHSRGLLNKNYSGFAVLAIDCAVIEALEQYRRGMPKTPHKKSKAYFKAFLTTARFKCFFSEDTASLFYDTLRCRILHQAEAEADSLVKRKHAAFVVKPSSSGAGLVLNTRRFHEELEGAFSDHKAALLQGDNDLRQCFIKKMNYVARNF